MCGCELLCSLFKRLMQFGRQEYPAHLLRSIKQGAAGAEGFLAFFGGLGHGRILHRTHPSSPRWLNRFTLRLASISKSAARTCARLPGSNRSMWEWQILMASRAACSQPAQNPLSCSVSAIERKGLTPYKS